MIDTGTLVFKRSNAYSVSNAISGAGSIVQSGSGNTTLTGNNTYSGTTNVSGGTLTVDNTSGSGTGTSAVTVYSGGTLRGTGTISGSVSVNSGGIVFPGDSSTGILNVGSYSSASSANLDIAINSSTAGSGYDQLNVSGSVSVTGTYLNLSGTRTNHDGDQIVAINNDGSDTVTGTFSSLPQGSRVVDNSVSYVLSYTGSSGNDVTIADSTPPTAANDNYNAEENVTLNQDAAHGVLSNDTGYNGGTLSVYSVDGSTGNVNHSISSSHGTLTLNSDGSFSYVPEHDYVGVDSASFYVASDGIEQSSSATVQFVIGPGILHTTSYSVSGVEGQSTGTVTVAHFTDDAALDSSYYNTQINWGDGTAPQNGAIASDGNGGWNVSGSHTYAGHGSFSASISITTNQGGYASTNAAATVSPSIPSVAGGQLMQAIAGSDSGTQLMATFADTHASDPLSDYSASVTYGDGTSATPGAITCAGGVYSVWGNHTYASNGTYTVSVVVSHAGAAASAVTSIASVGALDISSNSSNGLSSITVSMLSGSSPLDIRWFNGNVELYYGVTPPAADTQAGTPSISIPVNQLQSISVLGGTSSNIVSVDFGNVASAGTNLPFGIGGLSFDGNSATGSTLILTGNTGTSSLDVISNTAPSTSTAEYLQAPSGGTTYDPAGIVFSGAALSIVDSSGTESINIDSSGNQWASPATGPVNVIPSPGITVSQGATAPLSIGVGDDLAYLDISAGGIAALGTGTGQTIIVDSLSIASSNGIWLGTLDLANNDLVIHNGDVAQISSMVGSGYNAAHDPALWAGAGINAEGAVTNLHIDALGTIQNNDGTGNPIYQSFGGVPVTATDVLVMFTYYGDANLNGIINANDYTNIDNGSEHHLTGWYNGDFNYDGVVNGSDYTLMDNAFNTQSEATFPSPLLVNTPATISLPFTGPGEIDWGDGSGTTKWTTSSPTTANRTHAYTQAGVYAIRVASTPTNSQVQYYPAISITIVPAPVVTISGASSTIKGSNYTLSLSAQYPASNLGLNRSITSWVISWGDGTPDQTVPGNSSSVDHSFSTVYSPQYTSTISAHAVDGYGTYATNTVNVSVFQANLALTAAPVSDSQVNLSWTDNTGGTAYFNLYRSTSSSGPFTTPINSAPLLPGTSFYNDSGVQEGSYYYEVKATDSTGTPLSAPSGVGSVAVDTLPKTPINFVVTRISQYSVSFSWTNVSTIANSVEIIEMGDEGTIGYQSVTPPTTSGGTTSGAATESVGLFFNERTSYSFFLRANVGDWWSPDSSITTVATGAWPSAPSSLSASAVSDSKIHLSWQDNSGGTAKFNIYRSTNPSGPFTTPLVADLPPNTPGYDDTNGVNENTIYYYEVTAVNQVNVVYGGGVTASADCESGPAVERPSITAPASANPATITSNTSTLSVLGFYPSGESNLTYTWYKSGPGAVTFSPNGSNAAKNSVATFTAAGVYVLSAEVVGPGGYSVTSNVTVTVVPTVTRIAALTPSAVTVLPNATQQVSTTAYDQFGNTMDPDPVSWSVSDPTIGAIDGTGLFTAGSNYGPVTVTASAGGVSESATFVVGPLTTSNPVTAVALDSNDIEVFWLDLPSLSNGATLVMATDAQFTAVVATNTFPVHTTNWTAQNLSPATHYYFELLPTSSSTVVATTSATTNPLASDGSSPPAAPTITEQATSAEIDTSTYSLTMAASAYDPLSYSWQLISSSSGGSPSFTTDEQTTNVTFTMAGTYVFLGTVTDSSASTSVPSGVTVTVGQTATSIQLSFGSPTVVANGQSQFSASELDQFGMPMSSQSGFTWSVSSGIGSISSDGLYTAPSSNGTAAIQVTSDGLTSTADILVSQQSGVYVGNDGLIYVQATDVNEVKVFTTSGTLVNTLPFDGPFPDGITFRGAQDIYLADGSYLDASRNAPYPLVHYAANGSVIRTYFSSCPDNYWTGMALDPDGTSFWVCDESCEVYEIDIATGTQKQEFTASNDLAGLGVMPNLAPGIKLGDGSTNQVLQANQDGTHNLVPLTLYMPSGLNYPNGTQITLSTEDPAGVDVWDSNSPSAGSTPLIGSVASGADTYVYSSYTWTIGSPESVPNTLYLGATFASVSIGDILLTLTATVPGESTQPSATTQPATAISFRIKSLGFGGTGESSIELDDSSGSYGATDGSATQWEDGNLNGKVDGTANEGGTINAGDEHEYPLAYVRSMPGTSDTITVTVTFAQELPVGSWVKGLANYDGITFSAVQVAANNVNLGTGTTTLTFTANTPLGNTIDSNDLGVSWEFSTDNKKYKAEEQTSNHIYVTGASAPGAFETVLWLGCNAAKGMSPASATDAKVANAVFAPFTTLKIQEVEGPTGTPMTYWGAHAGVTSTSTDLFDVAGLLKNADGRCGSWQDLLIHIFAAQGITATPITVQVSPNIVMPPDNPPSAPPGGSVQDAGLVMAVNKPAQNTPNPWQYFSNHALVQVDGVGLYDPSYGKPYLPVGNAAYNEVVEEQAWQDASISGFYYEYAVLNANGTLNTAKVGSAFSAHVAGHNDVPTEP